APTEPGKSMPSDDAGSSGRRAASSRTTTVVWVVLLVVIAVAAWLLWRFLPHAPASKAETAPASAQPNATVEEADLPGARPPTRKPAEPNRAPYPGPREPRGAALDEEGRLWVADFGTSRLHIFDPDGGDLGGWGGFGNGQRRFAHPYGLAITGDTVYVADT